MRYLIKMKYDGSKFCGFQRLNDEPSVQKEIEEVLSKIFKRKIEIKGAGRTDRGVHALAQMAHFDVDYEIPVNNLKRAINRLINKYIYVTGCKLVDEDFHARFSVKEKTYVYKISIGEYNPINQDYYWNCKYNLDINLMKKCANLFIGGHNFENFVSGERDNYKAIINDIIIEKKKEEIILTFKGKSFYRYMVRSLVGAIVDIGRGKITLKEVEESLNRNSNQRFNIAPSNGLYLVDIRY